MTHFTPIIFNNDRIGTMNPRLAMATALNSDQHIVMPDLLASHLGMKDFWGYGQSKYFSPDRPIPHLFLDAAAAIVKPYGIQPNMPDSTIRVALGYLSRPSELMAMAALKHAYPNTLVACIDYPIGPNKVFTHYLDLVGVTPGQLPMYAFMRDLYVKEVQLLAVPSPFNQVRLAAIRRTPLARQLKQKNRKLVTVAVGGAAVGVDQGFLPRHVPDLVAKIRHTVIAAGHDLIIATSRRTDSTVESMLRDQLAGPHLRRFFTAADPDGYSTAMASADLIIVTDDSQSMTADACATNVPVLLADTSGNRTPLSRPPIEALYNAGRVQLLSFEPLRFARHPSIDPARQIATAIRRMAAQL